MRPPVRRGTSHAGRPPLDSRPASCRPFAKLVRRNLQRGRQAKEHARSDRRQQGEGKRGSIDPNAFQKRKLNALRCASPRVPATARRRPSAAPQHERVTLSVSTCRSSRKRPAPNAARTAISFCRVPMRAICRWERLAQTINITTPTAHISTTSAGRTCPLTCFSSGTSRRVDRIPLRVLAS